MSTGEAGASGAEEGYAFLGSHFAELRALLGAAHEGPPDPTRVVSFAGRAVPHADHCALTLVRGKGRPSTVASSGDVPPRVDLLQYRLAEGPCLDATFANDVVRVDDLRTERRWAEFAQACVAETPVRSMFSIRLVLSERDRAAMNFYAERPHAFDENDESIGAIFAPFAAMALQNSINAQEATQLHTALGASRQIGTAIGILMARELITSEDAFGRLVKASQDLNRKLRDIATEVEETGALPQLHHQGQGRGDSGRTTTA